MPIYTTILGMFLAVILALYARFNFRGNLFLAIFFFLYNFQEFVIYSLHVIKNPYLSVALLYNFGPLFFLIGPSFYFYIRSIIRNSAKVTIHDLWHLLPTTIVFFVLLPYYLQPLDYKITIATELGKSMKAYQHGFPFLIPETYIYIFRGCSTFGYSCYALWCYYTNISNLRQHSITTPHQRRSFEAWLDITFTCTLILALIYLTSTLQIAWIGKVAFFEPFQIGVGITLLSLNAILLFYPQILYGLPSFEHKKNDQSTDEEESLFDDRKNDLNADLLLFTESYIQTIESEIETVVESKAYCELDFSRSRLSNLTGIPAHHLSYYFTNILNTKFTNWRNDLRIEYAKQLIISDLMKTQTLDAISNKSGFANRQNFIASFKKATSLTPTGYLNLIKQNRQETSEV